MKKYILILVAVLSLSACDVKMTLNGEQILSPEDLIEKLIEDAIEQQF